MEQDNITFNLHETISEIVRMFAETVRIKGLKLISTIEQSVPLLVQGNPAGLRQSLVNILDNAVKFTREGEIVISVKKGEENVDSCQIVIEIRDTGIGIETGLKERMGEYFSRAGGSSTGQFDGMGRGLTIAKQLVEMMDGYISVESEPGKGSAFRFTVRLNKDSNRESPLDRQALEMIWALETEGEQKILDEVISIYLENSPEYLKAIRDGINGNDAEKVHRAAHSLKSSSAMLGAKRLSALCREMEIKGKNNSFENALELYSQIEAEYENAQEALKREMHRS
jgi:HPt (histidine-containing phosphotransfer) domain-containing protein